MSTFAQAPRFHPINRDTSFLSKIPINEKRSKSSTTFMASTPVAPIFMTSTPVASSGSPNFNYETPSPMKAAPPSSVDFHLDAGHTPHPAKQMELAVYPSALTEIGGSCKVERNGQGVEEETRIEG
jgi:hypothetical protein